jgi:hypothetical protein
LIEAALQLLVLLPISSPVFSQEPRARVPALPSAYPADCYLQNDTFLEKAEAAQSANLTAIERQSETNRGFRQRVVELDPDARRARLMAFVEKNPAGPAKATEQLQTFGAGAEAFPAVGTRLGEFRTELERLISDYRAERRRRLGPERIRSEAGSEQGFDAIYLGLCSEWFVRPAGPTRTTGPKGPSPYSHAFLDRYWDFLTREYVPLIEANDAANKRFLEAMGVPAPTFASTANMDAVDKYLAAARTIFAVREPKPRDTNR